MWFCRYISKTANPAMRNDEISVPHMPKKEEMELRAVGVSESFRHHQLQDLVYKATCIKRCNYMYLGTCMIRYNNLVSFFFLEL